MITETACRAPHIKSHAERVIRVRPAPRREPPFDDELPEERRCMVSTLDRPLPFVQIVEPAVIVVRPPRDSTLPDPAIWARRLLVGIVEAAGGKRPLHQLGGLLSPTISHGLRTDFQRAVALRARHWTHAATVRSIRASEPTPGVAEVCATLQIGRRVRAAALRVEEHQGRWMCTRLQLG